jgi:predicted O-methyltransferase YrrM
VTTVAIGPSAPVQIAQLDWEFERALGLYKARKPKRVLEIGTWLGGTLFHWLKEATPGTQVVTVDIEDNDVPFDEWCPEGVECRQIIGDSHDPKTVEDVKASGPFDWLFIDGSHVYEDAKADWELYRPMVENGVVLLHDISLQREYPETGQTAGVWRLWREIQASGHLTQELRIHPTEYGIGICFV